MQERNIKTAPATYTGLFNACANSPYPNEALIKLNHLRKVLAENNVELNLVNYNAMIKGMEFYWFIFMFFIFNLRAHFFKFIVLSS